MVMNPRMEDWESESSLGFQEEEATPFRISSLPGWRWPGAAVGK
jgi:hypothetical protein